VTNYERLLKDFRHVCPVHGGDAHLKAEPPQGRKKSMIQQSPNESTSGAVEGQGLRLGAGAIASLTGAGLLLVFMIQNTEDVTLDFLFWSFAYWGVRMVRTWRDAPSPAPEGTPRSTPRLTCTPILNRPTGNCVLTHRAALLALRR
jgi:hypothetical protein